LSVPTVSLPAVLVFSWSFVQAALADGEAAAAPDVVVAMPCGLYAEQAAAEAVRHRERLAALGARVVAVDAAAYFSRPGPRLVEGIELLGHLFHPDRVPAPPSRRSVEVDIEHAVAAGR